MSFKALSKSDRGWRTMGHVVRGALSPNQRKAILSIADTPPEREPRKEVGESRAEFWVCKCGRRHKVRYEAHKKCVLRCPMCEDYYGG